MSRKRLLLLVYVLLCYSFASQNAQAEEGSEKQIVEQHFPKSIIEIEKKWELGSSQRFFEFVLGDLDSIGSRNYIVAAYTSYIDHVVSVLRKEGDSVVLVDEKPLKTGEYADKISLINLDNDLKKIPEIVIHFTRMRGEETFVFRWDGKKLNILNPLNEDGMYVAFNEPSFSDTDGDGKIEIIDVIYIQEGVVKYTVFTLEGNSYHSSSLLNDWPDNIPINRPPISDAGVNIIVDEGKSVTLDGTRSFEEDPLIPTYSWSQIAGPTVKLDNPKSATPTFVAPTVTKDTVLTFRLVINDQIRDSAPSDVNITVRHVVSNASPASNSGVSSGGGGGGCAINQHQKTAFDPTLITLLSFVLAFLMWKHVIRQKKENL